MWRVTYTDDNDRTVTVGPFSSPGDAVFAIPDDAVTWRVFNVE